MDEWSVSASASGDVDLGLIPELGQTNHFKIGIHSFLFDAQHSRDSVENKPASLLVPMRKALTGFPNLGMVDKRSALKRARYSALIAFCDHSQRHGQAVSRAVYRSYVTGSIRGWS